MRIAIFHPQMNTFGGGEMVAVTIAEILSREYDVDIISPKKVDKKKLEQFFGKDLSKVNIKTIGMISNIIENMPSIQTLKPKFYVSDAQKLKGYDLIFDTGTNGMFYKHIKTKTACYVHFPSFPGKKKGLKSLLNGLIIDPNKAYVYDRIISNSEFTRNSVLRYSSGKKSIVINPPVEVKHIILKKIPFTEKNNWIGSIGRFSPDKKLEVMIEAFKKFHKQNPEWELHIIGAYMKNEESVKYYEMLNEFKKGYPIVFHENMNHDDVIKFMPKCKFYWHSRGYGETEDIAMENFGICTVEGMAAGCVPLVINKGAQPEIVDHGKCGYLWDEPEELIEFSNRLVKDQVLYNRLSEAAKEKSMIYDISIFNQKILSVVKELIGD